MKKSLFSVILLTTMLFVSSCANDDNIVSDQSSSSFTTFTVGCGNAFSRSISDGMGINTLYYETYLDNAKLTGLSGKVSMENQKATITLNLTRGKKYTFAFWAQNSNCTAYDVSDLKNVKISYEGYKSNDETRDAFCKVLSDVEISRNNDVYNVVLKRPFAQLNLGGINNTSNVSFTESSLKISNVANAINIVSDEISGKTNLNLSSSAVPTEKLKTDINGDGTDEEFDYLSMNYILVDSSTDLYNPEFTLDNSMKISSPYTPLKRNYRTNVIYDLSSNTVLNVSINPLFDNSEPISDGLVLNENGVYEISNGNGLATASEKYFTNGGTYSIVKDIDMSNIKYIPTIANSNQNGIIIKGNNHVIFNLSISDVSGAALISRSRWDVTISDLTIKDSSMKSTNQDGENTAAAFVGFMDIGNGTFTNCKTENVNLSNAKYIGGIIAYMSGKTTMTNCEVNGANIDSNYQEKTIYKGHAGGLIGLMTSGNISSCTVDKVSIIGQWSDGYERYGAIVGTVGTNNSTVTIDNNIISGCTLKGVNVVESSQLHGVVNVNASFTNNTFN